MVSKNLRVLIVQPHMTVYGGAETLVEKFAKCLTKGGIENTVLTLSLSGKMKNICVGIKFILPEKNYPFKIRSMNFWDSAGVVMEINALAKLLSKYIHFFDLVNVHNFPATWAAVFSHSLPTVWMCNEPPDLYANPDPSLPLKILRNLGIFVDRFVINRYIDSICVADEFNAKRVFERYHRKPKITPYGIDYDIFSLGNGETVRRKYHLDNNFLLLQVGVITPQKNQLESIRTLEKVKDKIPNVKLILAGWDEGPYAEMVKGYTYVKGLKEYVIFTGQQSKSEIANLYYACDIALYPVKSQGGWLAPFEALCAGKPVVVSPTMGAADLVSKEDIGIVTENYVDSVLDIYCNYLFYKGKAEKGRQFVAKNLTWEIFTKKMLKVFEETLEKKR